MSRRYLVFDNTDMKVSSGANPWYQGRVSVRWSTGAPVVREGLGEAATFVEPFEVQCRIPDSNRDVEKLKKRHGAGAYADWAANAAAWQEWVEDTIGVAYKGGLVDDAGDPVKPGVITVVGAVMYLFHCGTSYIHVHPDGGVGESTRAQAEAAATAAQSHVEKLEAAVVASNALIDFVLGTSDAIDLALNPADLAEFTGLIEVRKKALAALNPSPS